MNTEIENNLFKQIRRGEKLSLTDMKGRPFEVKAAFWGELLIGLKFTQYGKKIGSPLMNSTQIKNYLNQF